MMEVDGLLLGSDPSVVLYVEVKTKPSDRDVQQLVLRAAALSKALESSNPLNITNRPPQLDCARDIRVVALLGGGSFSPCALRAAKQAGVVPVMRSGTSFCLMHEAPLPHALQPAAG
jgi:hypothetical protein